MSESYCKYKNKIFPLDIHSNTLELTSNESEDINNGFKEYIDVLGNKHSDILIKEVSLDEVEFAYELSYKVIYKGTEFNPWAIGKLIINKDEISLFTSNSEQANQYEFTKKEQFIFKKEVKLDEIEALIEIKKPILKFKYIKEEKIKIEKKDIRNYLKNLNKVI